MDKFKNLDKKKRLILISSIITLIILGIVSATVAYFAWVGEESSISVTVLGGEGRCSVKEDNNMFLEPTDVRDNGRIIKFTAEQMLGQEAYVSWTMKINKTNGLNHETFRYEMINTTTGASYGSGNFGDITDGSIISFSNVSETLSINTKYEFTLYLWIDGTIGNNPLSMAGQELDFDMACTMFDEPASDIEVTPLSDFTYILGSETPVVNYIDGIQTPSIPLAENDVLLVDYIADSRVVVVPDSYEVNGVVYNVVLLTYFYNEVYYENDVQYIDDYYKGVFVENTYINEVTIGNNVKTIYAVGDNLFAESFYNENSATALFYNCTNLVSVHEIPDSVTNMSYTFKGCTSLTGTVRINSSNVTDIYEIFYDTSNLITVEVPAGSTTYNTFSNASLPSNVTISPFDFN